MSKLVINSIKNGEIFKPDFDNLTSNNTIEFSKQKNAVIYGANGTGKTSFSKIFIKDEGCLYEVEFNGNKCTSKDVNNIFHVIKDQNNRNIIVGNDNDFMIGKEIEEEYELSKKVDTQLLVIKSSIIKELSNMGIRTKSSPLLNIVTISEIRSVFKDFANSRNKGKDYAPQSILNLKNKLSKPSPMDYTDDKLVFFKVENNFNKLQEFLDIQSKLDGILRQNPGIVKIPEYSSAISILEQFPNHNECIVCDTSIQYHQLLEKKQKSREFVLSLLGKQQKEIVDYISTLKDSDPFKIKEALYAFMDSGDRDKFDLLCKEIQYYKDVYISLLINIFFSIPEIDQLSSDYAKLTKLQASTPTISDDDINLIQEISQSCLSKKIEIKRDSDKKLRLFLGEAKFLGVTRPELHLSAGEQNFISLAVEFIIAKNNASDIVIIDDPISSFDSIYKNKVAYIILKFLEKKHTIILTHNLDLVRLLEHQYDGCFSLYLLNNNKGEQNGFIAISEDELDLLLYLNKLVAFFKNAVLGNDVIKDSGLFFLSSIPFMRGYANIIQDSESYKKLSGLMHGFNNNAVNISTIYQKIFNTTSTASPEYSVPQELIIQHLNSHDDIKEIVDKTKYPLLNKTLNHSLTYLALRLLVEKTISEKYNHLTFSDGDSLGEIIQQAFPSNEKNSDKKRIRINLLSKKTLLNEFNHFEGNLSIFQPAIDISDAVLKKEKDEIKALMENLPI